MPLARTGETEPAERAVRLNGRKLAGDDAPSTPEGTRPAAHQDALQPAAHTPPIYRTNTVKTKVRIGAPPKQ